MVTDNGKITSNCPVAFDRCTKTRIPHCRQQADRTWQMEHRAVKPGIYGTLQIGFELRPGHNRV